MKFPRTRVQLWSYSKTLSKFHQNRSSRLGGFRLQTHVQKNYIIERAKRNKMEMSISSNISLPESHASIVKSCVYSQGLLQNIGAYLALSLIISLRSFITIGKIYCPVLLTAFKWSYKTLIQHLVVAVVEAQHAQLILLVYYNYVQSCLKIFIRCSQWNYSN